MRLIALQLTSASQGCHGFARARVKQTADLLREFYMELQRCGFTEQEAMQFTLASVSPINPINMMETVKAVAEGADKAAKARELKSKLGL